MYEKRVTAGKEFMNHMKKGLLAVSFGTSVNETREKTIDAIERELAAACPGLPAVPGLDQPYDYPKTETAGSGAD